jgi:hypothetical protein
MVDGSRACDVLPAVDEEGSVFVTLISDACEVLSVGDEEGSVFVILVFAPASQGN